MAHLKEEFSKHRQLAKFIGATDVVLHHVFQFLSADDLKTCRLVNRKWRDVARLLFKKRMSIVFQETDSELNINLARCVQSFVRDFEKSSESVPFTCFNFCYYYNILTDKKMDVKFLNLFGNQIRHLTVTVQHLDGVFPMRKLLEFRSILFNHMKNIEYLSIRFLLSEKEFPESDWFARPDDELLKLLDLKNSHGANLLQLNNLKKIRYYVGVKGRGNSKQQDVVTKVLEDILNAAKNLQYLETNTSLAAMIAIHNTTVPNGIKIIKELSLTNWRCDNCQSSNSLDILSLMASVTPTPLVLESFSIHLKFGRRGETVHNDFIVVPLYALLKFIATQNKSLTKLNIILPGFLYEESLGDFLEGQDLAHFPKMEKLESLTLAHSHKTFYLFFANEEKWTELFPKLKTFEHHYYVDLESVFPKLIENLPSPTETVTEVILCANTNSFLYSAILLTFEKSDFVNLYNSVKQKFPNLKLLKFTNIDLHKVYVSHSNNIEDVAVYDNVIPRTLSANENSRIVDEEIFTSDEEAGGEDDDWDLEDDEDDLEDDDLEQEHLLFEGPPDVNYEMEEIEIPNPTGESSSSDEEYNDDADDSGNLVIDLDEFESSK